jgi:transposase
MYNAAQIQEFELFDQFLYQLVSLIEEPERNGPGRPSLKLRDQLFCCIMKVYSQLSCRRAKYLYQDALLRQQISHNPYFNSVSATLNKPEITPILHELVRLSAQPLAGIEADFAVDSSGFRCSTFGEYCSYAHGTSKRHNWLKVHISTGVYTNVISDVVITDEHGADSPQFKKLIKNTAKNFSIHEVSADAAYSSRKNLETVSKYGGTAYIPFKSNATGMSKNSILWRRAFHYFQLHKDEFLEHYHKRSNAESTFSAIKKKFGETIKSKNRTAQVNEMLCKIIAYNITVVIREMIEFGFDTKFLSLDSLQKEETLKPSNEYGLEGN